MPAGIGNVAGAVLVAVREVDGLNQLCNEAFPGEGRDRIYKRPAYADYTAFEPTDSAYHLSDPSK